MVNAQADAQAKARSYATEPVKRLHNAGITAPATINIHPSDVKGWGHL